MRRHYFLKKEINSNKEDTFYHDNGTKYNKREAKVLLEFPTR